MDARTRLVNTLNFKPVVRLPVLEWSGWWDRTIDRWHTEGLPVRLTDASEIRAYFGMDGHRQYRVPVRKGDCPASPGVGKGIVDGMDDNKWNRPPLYPEEAFDASSLAVWEERHTGMTGKKINGVHRPDCFVADSSQ